MTSKRHGDNDHVHDAVLNDAMSDVEREKEQEEHLYYRTAKRIAVFCIGLFLLYLLATQCSMLDEFLFLVLCNSAMFFVSYRMLFLSSIF